MDNRRQRPVHRPHACEHLVYLPETDFDKDEFLAAVKEKWAKGRGLLVTVSEGIHYAGGAPVADSGIVDGFGHKVPAARRRPFPT